MIHSARSVAVLAALLLLSACGGNECKLDDPGSCSEDQICEVVQGKDKPMCFAPLAIKGKVTNIEDGAVVANATITALDENGSPAASVATSDTDGNYTLRIPTDRADDKGTPVFRKVSLRAAAADFQTFPSGVRISLPIDTSGSSKDDANNYSLSNDQTNIALSPVPAAEKGRSSVSGTVEITGDQKGVLVVIESGGNGYSAIADNEGNWKVFNVPSGGAKASAYSRGVNYTPADINVEGGKNLEGVSIKKSDVGTGTVTGSVSIVSSTVQKATSVILVVDSTFNAGIVRGESPPGLRAPNAGTAPNIDGAFSIDGVPDGKYVVLAAFENDTLVRDPNPNTGGTAIRRVTVANGAVTTDDGSGLAFKVTGALTINSPGGGDALDVVAAPPTFSFKEYSSAKDYRVQVFNAQGVQIWTTTVPTGNSGDKTVLYAGSSPLTSGGVYQFRVTALGNAGNPISTTEDLRGVFRVQ